MVQGLTSANKKGKGRTVNQKWARRRNQKKREGGGGGASRTPHKNGGQRGKRQKWKKDKARGNDLSGSGGVVGNSCNSSALTGSEQETEARTNHCSSQRKAEKKKKGPACDCAWRGTSFEEDTAKRGWCTRRALTYTRETKRGEQGNLRRCGDGGMHRGVSGTIHLLNQREKRKKKTGKAVFGRVAVAGEQSSRTPRDND